MTFESRPREELDRAEESRPDRALNDPTARKEREAAQRTLREGNR